MQLPAHAAHPNHIDDPHTPQPAPPADQTAPPPPSPPKPSPLPPRPAAVTPGAPVNLAPIDGTLLGLLNLRDHLMMQLAQATAELLEQQAQNAQKDRELAHIEGRIAELQEQLRTRESP